MRSRELAFALLVACAMPQVHGTPTRQEALQAADAVRQLPELGGKRKERTLREKEKKSELPQSRDPAPSLLWLAQLLRWLAESARALVWVIGAVFVAMVLVRLHRWIRVRGDAIAPLRGAPPTHVRSLDIRPESLPADVGAAAARLWEQGEHRAALSLLYRGALSRLVHGWGVAIHAASTEGECIALARARLDPQRTAFFAGLVGAWRLAVYGGRLPEREQALALCRAFEAQFRPEAAR